MTSLNTKLILFLVLGSFIQTWIVDPNSASFLDSIRATPKVTIQNYRSGKIFLTQALDRLSKVSDLAKMMRQQRSLSGHCLGAENICSNEKCSPILIYHSSNIFNNLGCTNTLGQSVFDEQTSILQKTDDLRFFYAAFHTFIFSSKSQTAEKYCDRLSEWIPSTGLPRFRIRELSQSLVPSRLIWEMNLICKNDKIQKDLYALFASKVVEINASEYVVADNKETLNLSAFFIREVLKRQGSSDASLTDSQLSGLIQFVVNKSEGAELTELKYILQAAKMMDNIGVRFPILRSRLITGHNNVKLGINNSQEASISWDSVDVYNRNADGGSDSQIQYQIHYQNKKTQTSENKLQLEISGSSVDLQFVQVIKEFQISHNLSASINKELKVSGSKLAITTNTYFPKYISDQFKQIQSATGLNFIHVIVTLEGEVARPDYISVYLKNSSGDKSSSTLSVPVIMKFNDRAAGYYGVIDLGDPNLIFPSSGTYGVVVFIGDISIVSNIEMEIAKVQIQFQNQSPSTSRSDSFVEKKQKIFPIVEDEPKSNLLSNIIFTVIAVLIFLVYLYLARQMSTNSNLFPSMGIKQIFNFVFLIVAYGISYFLIVYLWIHERFMDLVFPIVLMYPVTLIIGNLALSGLSKRKEGKEKKEQVIN